MTPKEVRAEWTKRLRSGEYKQGKNYLRKIIGEEEQFCCLGVLCEIAVEQGVIEPARLESTAYTYNLMYGAPPFAVMKWSGLYPLGQSSPYKYSNDTLVGMNDTEGRSFEEIADFIDTIPEAND